MDQRERWVKGLFALSEKHGRSLLSSESPLAYLDNRIAQLEAALREIAQEMDGAHDGSCVYPVRDVLRKMGFMK